MQKKAKLVISGVLVALVCLFVWWQLQPEPAPTEAPQPTPAPASETAAEPAQETVGQAEGKTTEEAAPETVETVAPDFDVVRVSPEGQTVIAGRAGPGQEVEILLDGQVIGTAEADAIGAFAAVLDIPPSNEARELALRVLLAADDPAAGEPTVLALAPTEAKAEPATGAESGSTAGASRKDATTPPAEAQASTATTEGVAEPSMAEVPAARTGSTGEPPAAAAVATEAATAVVQAVEKAATQAAAEVEAAEAAAEAAARAEADKAAAEVDAAKATAELDAKIEAEEASTEAEAAKAAAETAVKAETGKVTAQAEAARAADTGVAEPKLDRYAVSTPVVILPQSGAEEAPLLVKPEAEDVTLPQPAQVEPAQGIVLDRLTYSHQGDLIAAGRGRVGAVVRIYVNAVFHAQVRCNDTGRWRVAIASGVATRAKLLRFDEIDADGAVVSRLETPFEYSPAAETQGLRQRKIEVQKGNYLWKFAEQYYGEGWRYSVIFSANSALIRDPDLIYPGQVFTIPELVDSQ